MNAASRQSSLSGSPGPSPTLPLAVVDSRDLLKGANTVVIEHAGQRYILRVTRENKLILTK